MIAIGIDPGPVTSGIVIVDYDDWPPRVLRSHAEWHPLKDPGFIEFNPFIVVVEVPAYYAKAVGADVFDTLRIVGRIEERAARLSSACYLITRPDVGLELGQSRSATKGVIHEAIRKIYRDAGRATGGGADPVKGTAKQPGPLYGIKDHAWDALAVLLAWRRPLIEGRTPLYGRKSATTAMGADHE